MAFLRSLLTGISSFISISGDGTGFSFGSFISLSGK